MANINGNNIDDLFRQASDQYPLRTDSSDWGKLAGALEADPSLISPQVIEQDNKRRRRRILWLFLPLIAGGIGYYTWQSAHTAPKNSMTSSTLHGNADAAAQITEGIDRQNKINAKEVAVNKATAANENGAGTAVAAVPKTGVGHEYSIAGKLKDQDRSGGESSNMNPGKKRSGQYRLGTNAKPGGRELTLNKHRATPGKNSSSPNENNVNDGNDVDQVRVAGSSSTNQEANTIIVNGILKPRSGTSPDAQYSKVDGPGYLAKDNISVQADVRSKWPASPESQVKTVVKGPKAPQKHAIYMGILGAPDLSTIDFQKIKSVGTTYGILGGYTFNQTWSLETGVYLDKKKYFTDGHYFSKKNVPALQYIDLQNVDGTCNMVEIPLNLRYNLSQGKQRKIFATAGLSTYLMSKEWYAYQIWAVGGGSTNKSFTYTNPYHYLFSIVNLSIGYEQKLGKIGDLRVEPYLRIPLSGIGTGSLSILSAGLNLGITRRIW